MTIAKGYLRRKGVISQQQLISGIILWITYSYVLYAFFYLFREAFRFLTTGVGDQILLILDAKENFIYNLFYASIASSLGYIISLKFVLQNSTMGQSRRSRFFIRRTINDGGFFFWSFLFWFGKIMGVLGITYIYLQFEINFLIEFPLLLCLIPIVVFLSTWPGLRMFLGQKTFQWFIVSFGLFTTMSFIFALKDFIEVDQINKNLLKTSVEYSYGLSVPVSEYHKPIARRYLATDLYLVNDSVTSIPVIFLDDVYNRIDIKKVSENLMQEKAKYSVYDEYQMVINLHINKNIQLSYVNKLKREIRKSGIGRVQYSTFKVDSKYPSYHPIFKYSGIEQYLYPWYLGLEPFLDSAENLDFSKYTIRIPEAAKYRIIDIKKYNRVELKVDRSKVYLNGRQFTKAQLKALLYALTKKYSPKFAVIYSPSDEIKYERYIEYLDLIYSVNYQVKNEMSQELFNKPYEQMNPFDDRYSSDEKDSINAKYPRMVIEWTPEEKRLMKLINKAANN
jgi:biopolymer transport protein ExbD